MRRILVATAFLAAATPSWAGLHRWTPAGPELGAAIQVLPDPSTSDVVWALVNNRPFRSTDGGASWTERSAGLPFPGGLYTEAIAIDPAQPGTLLAVVRGAELHRTTDAGMSWTRALDASALGSLFHLRADPTAPGTFYATPGVGTLRVQRSTDHGATWAPVGAAPGSTLNDYVQDFAVDPASAGRWYVVLYNSGVNRLLVSTNAGESWVARGSGLPAQFSRLVVTPTSPPTLWLFSTATGLHRSTDGGMTFTQSGLGRTDVRIVAVDPSDPRAIYGVRDVVQAAQFFRSTDGGTTWNPVDLHAPGLPNTSLASLAVDPFAATHLWAGAARDGILDSPDGGASWTTSSRGLPRTRTICTLASAPGGATLHAVADGALWTSRDGGASWTPSSPEASPGPPFAPVVGVTIDPTDPDVVYAASPAGVFKSGDGAASWDPANAGLPASGARSVAVDPSTPLTLYATTSAGVYRSLDGGASWALRGPGVFSTLVVDPTLPTTIYFDGGVAVSRDGGATTATPSLLAPMLSLPPEVLLVRLLATVAPAPSLPGAVYAGVDATLFQGGFTEISSLNVSDDRLATFTRLSSAIAPTALAVDPTDDQSLYVGRTDGARRSRDGGSTLEPFDAGLRGTPCAFSGGAPGERLYAGTQQTNGVTASFGLYAIAEPACAADLDCDDGSDCTLDRCAAGRCAHDAATDGATCSHAENACDRPGTCVAGTCRASQSCNDGDACTTDSCRLPGTCQHDAIAGCCTSAAQCDDGDACTIDTCTTSRCVSSVDPERCDDRRLASASIRLTTRGMGTRLTFDTSDPSLLAPAPGGANDPTLAGATVELFTTGTAPQTWPAPPGVGRPGWKVQSDPTIGYRYRNPAAPSGPSTLRALTLRARPHLRLTAVPPGPPIATGLLDRVGIRITMGDLRLCALFEGAAIRKNRPGRFVARGKMLPAGDCTAASLGAGDP